MIQPLLGEEERQEIRSDLQHKFGLLVGGSDLAKLLGFKTMNAFRQAVRRKALPIKVFELENRRGKFALSEDLAHWLATLKARTIAEPERNK